MFSIIPKFIPKFIGVVLSCAVLALLGALGGCQSTTGKTAGQTITDASISSAVQTKLTNDHLSNFTRIDVDTDRGVVNLSGVVETEEQRARAGRLAHHVTGFCHPFPASQANRAKNTLRALLKQDILT